MQLIETKTLGTSASSILFSAIPQTFTDLYVLVSSRSDGAFTSSEIDIAFNGSSSNFTARYLYGTGSTAASTTDTTLVGVSSAANNTSNTFGNASIYIPNYTGSTNKSISTDSVGESNATAAYQAIAATLWSQTAAITSLTLTLDSGARNFVAGSTVSLYGIGGVGDGYPIPKATGGIISYAPGYVIHTFTASGTFTPTQNLTNVEYLVIAGGGAGGGRFGAGGGGAGGYRSSVTGESSGGGASAESKLSLTSGTGYTVTVGAGGAGVNATVANGGSGSNSVFGSVTSTGGGGGGQAGGGSVVGSGVSGGSGGGSGTTNTTRTPGSGTANQGYAGGTGSPYTDPYSGGGGGGAGAAGGNGGSLTGVGGVGVSSSITGVATFRAGGGGGGQQGSTTLAGGNGGGGASSAGNGNAGSGTPNTGGGGGGLGQGASGETGSSGNGGSGIVIVRYAA